MNVGFTVMGIVHNEKRHHEHQGPMTNPLDGVRFSKRVLLLLGGGALASSVIISLLLIYT